MIYEFQATQSFNGYDKPWAGGAGKNKFDKDAITDNVYLSTITGLPEDAKSYCITDYIPVESGVNVYIPQTNSSRRWFYSSDKTPTTYLSNSDNQVFTPEEDGFIRVSIDKRVINLDTYQIEYGSAASSYAPYANVCMPEGFNIWDPYNAEFIQVYAGYVNANIRELYLRPVYEEYDGEELVGPWMSSLDLYAEDTTPTEGAFVIDFGGKLTSYEITAFMLQTLLDSLGIRQHFTDGAGLLNSLMDQAQGRVRSEEELLHLSRPLKVIAIGDQLPAGIKFKPISKDVLPGLPGKFIR